MKKSKKFVVGCNLVAALCFGIASCGHFSLRRTGLGWVFALLSAAQLILAVMNGLTDRWNRKQ